MITRKILLCMIALMTFAMETHAQWKAYLSYYEPKEIEQANDGMLYVLASGGLFSYSTQDQEVRTYDKTTLLSGGRVVEMGSPAELLKKNGLFRHMAQLQSESMEWTA